MLFSLIKHHFDLNITDTALKVSRSLYCFTTPISHGVENYFPRLWGTGISDAIFVQAPIMTLLRLDSYCQTGHVVCPGKQPFPAHSTLPG